ncbi:hypothetical protein NEOLEDRAFT_1157587 [Neolentinus lepideus HHB14362 ss-1]|uniref:DUF3533 domain-containing protein n=1 Tax=Neolentinus lepideus HHB14362 ss-1 TaxID=1314782 RepID=A0A165QTX9_9AGAM|nr:hypothetical protein NEOLEDRAFT_1157587 [Neolentinus lepideus HHB14362 ss-1]
MEESEGKAVQIFSYRFWDEDPVLAQSRAMYLKVVVGGIVMITLTIWSMLPIYWGASWKPGVQLHKLHGWIVDFDGGMVGQAVTQAFSSATGLPTQITWQTIDPARFPNGVSDVYSFCFVVIPNATHTLQQAVASRDSSYNGSLIITAYGTEARNENGYRAFLSPITQGILQQVSLRFALQFTQQLASSGVNITSLAAIAPSTIVQPIGYTMDNVRPFDVPVASAVDLVGLIYLIILSFIASMINCAARETVSGIDRLLTLRSLLLVRVLSPLAMYFFISLSYSLVSLAFQVPFSRTLAHAGFFVYWMLSWMSMSALGLACESILTLLTQRFIAFFLFPWIISNVSVCSLPIEALPGVFRYGYAVPFYNVSKAVRTIVFGTKNELGLNFGVQFAWISVSCITLTLFQIWRRRRMVQQAGERMRVQGSSEK